MKQLDVHGPKPEFSGGLISLHATLILLAYGAFGLSSVAALMYLTQEHNLKFHKLQAIVSLLPPIQRLEVVTSQLLIGGFVLLTLGLALAPLLVLKLPGVSIRNDPKVVWSGFVWVMYLVLVVAHRRYSSGGRKFAWGAVGGFAFVLLTFWGFNLLSKLHNP